MSVGLPKLGPLFEVPAYRQALARQCLGVSLASVASAVWPLSGHTTHRRYVTANDAADHHYALGTLYAHMLPNDSRTQLNQSPGDCQRPFRNHSSVRVRQSMYRRTTAPAIEPSPALLQARGGSISRPDSAGSRSIVHRDGCEILRVLQSGIENGIQECVVLNVGGCPSRWCFKYAVGTYAQLYPY